MKNLKYLARLFWRNIIDYFRYFESHDTITPFFGLIFFPIALILCIPKTWIDFYTRKPPLETDVIISIQSKINALKGDQLEQVANALSKTPHFFSSSYDSLYLGNKMHRPEEEKRTMIFQFFGDEKNNGKKTHRAIYNAIVAMAAPSSPEP